MRFFMSAPAMAVDPKPPYLLHHDQTWWTEARKRDHGCPARGRLL